MESVEHPVALKVMRLTRPALVSAQVITSEAKDLPGPLINNYLKEDPLSVRGLETVTAGHFMLLPQSFGSIYLGETFSCYICVHNESDKPVKNVAVKADLQTSCQRIPLTGDRDAPPREELKPDDTVNDVIHHEVKDLGTHILVCEVTYTSALETPASFRKFFKFQVVKPLDVKTKFYNANSGEVFLEAQVQNVTGGPICLERVALECSPTFDLCSLNTVDSDKSVFGSMNLLRPGAACQYLYRLIPKGPVMLPVATDIGKLDIVWRSNLGERGRLQTSQLQREAPNYGDVRLMFTSLPCEVKAESPFEFECRIINTGERKMDLLLNLRAVENSGLLWTGLSERNIGTVEPGSSTLISLCAFPINRGLQSVKGISLTDTFLKRTYEYDDLASVFVV